MFRWFKIGFAAVLAAVVIWAARQLVWPYSFFLTAENHLGQASCVVTLDDGKTWAFDVKPNETASRFTPFVLPEHLNWTCKTTEGDVTGYESNGCLAIWGQRPLEIFTLARPSPIEAFC